MTDAVSGTHGRGRPAGVTILVLFALMAAAVAVRLHGLNQDLVTFHPTRHYRSAVLARACYDEATPATPAWALGVARANRDIQPAGEPQVLEWIACAAYRIVGYEDIEIPRVVSVICWVIGALPIWFIGRRWTADAIALVGAALFLFLPYGIVASRNFQPDPLMTMSCAWAILGLLRHHEKPTAGRRYLAAALTGLALLLKPMSVFLVLPVAIGLAVAQRGWRRLPRSRALVVLLVLALIPPGIFYGYSTLFGSLAQDQMKLRFVPSLLPTAFFWHGLLKMIRRVYGLPILAAAVAGTMLAPTRAARAVLAALWVGYVAFAVAFTYHMPTHDYYHLPYLVLAALGVVALLERVRATIARDVPAPAMLAGGVLACAAVALWGSAKAWPALTVPNAAAIIARDQRIGELTQHDRRVLFLDPEYGYSLMYHGQLSGDYWPNVDDLAAEAYDGATPIDARDRFVRDYADTHPTYFVATDMSSLKAEKDLQQLLAERAVPVEQAPTYQVYRFVDP
ncbi:MAG: glycosyltransferase family 39 protein [Acidobacteriota bacterium]